LAWQRMKHGFKRGMQCQTASGGPDSYPACHWMWWWRNLRFAPSVPAQACRKPVQHSASSPSSGRGCSARSSSLHSSAAHHLPRRWCCLCHLQLSLLGLSLSPLHPPLLLTISILLWLHHRACRSLARPHPLTRTRTRLHPRAAFHVTLSPHRCHHPKSLPYVSSVIGCRSSAVGSPSLAPQTRCASNPAQLSKSADPPLFGLPVSGEQQDCLHLAHTP
jgi:hypothetical protein